MKHFKLRTDLTKDFFGITLYRVELTIDCKWGKKGDLGGWIEKESNLQDNAWVYGNALVYGNAQVYGNARVYGNAQVCGDAQVYGDALVYGNARVYGNAQVCGDARVYGNTKVEKYGQCVVINNLKNNITLTPNLIIIGCKTWKNLKEFEATYKQIGKDNNYTEDETEMTAELVRAIMKRMTPIQDTIQIVHNGAKFEIDLEKAKELGIIK